MQYEQLYEMTPKELLGTLENRRKGLAYIIWKQAYLNGMAFSGKDFPRTPKEASKELYPKTKTIPIPEVLRSKIGG